MAYKISEFLIEGVLGTLLMVFQWLIQSPIHIIAMVIVISIAFTFIKAIIN